MTESTRLFLTWVCLAVLFYGTARYIMAERMAHRIAMRIPRAGGIFRRLTWGKRLMVACGACIFVALEGFVALPPEGRAFIFVLALFFFAASGSLLDDAYRRWDRDLGRWMEGK